jgi:hypothetical protein
MNYDSFKHYVYERKNCPRCGSYHYGLGRCSECGWEIGRLISDEMLKIAGKGVEFNALQKMSLELVERRAAAGWFDKGL